MAEEKLAKEKEEMKKEMEEAAEKIETIKLVRKMRALGKSEKNIGSALSSRSFGASSNGGSR